MDRFHFPLFHQEVVVVLKESLSSCKTLKEKVSVILSHYASRKINGPLEPEWIHVAYELLQKFADDKASKNDYVLIKDLIASHEISDGSDVWSIPGIPSSPKRIIHDCWKVGSPTWVFMGRNNPNSAFFLIDDWIAVRRKIPESIFKMFNQDLPDETWIAYNRKQQMGTTTTTANCIGPAFSWQQLINAVEEKVGSKIDDLIKGELSKGLQ